MEGEPKKPEQGLEKNKEDVEQVLERGLNNIFKDIVEEIKRPIPEKQKSNTSNVEKKEVVFSENGKELMKLINSVEFELQTLKKRLSVNGKLVYGGDSWMEGDELEKEKYEKYFSAFYKINSFLMNQNPAYDD